MSLEEGTGTSEAEVAMGSLALTASSTTVVPSTRSNGTGTASSGASASASASASATSMVVASRKSKVKAMTKVRLSVVRRPVPGLFGSIVGVDYHPTYVILGGLAFVPAGWPLYDQVCTSHIHVTTLWL